jgi:hypothetical protein
MIVLALGAVSFAGVMLACGQPARKDGVKGEPPERTSSGSYAKIRVEVEVRGTLQMMPQGATVTAVWRSYDLSDDTKEVAEASGKRAWKLDFAQAGGLQKTAARLDGKEVVVTGQAELRMVVQSVFRTPGGGSSSAPPPPFPAPTWRVGGTVMVAGLRLADGE